MEKIIEQMLETSVTQSKNITSLATSMKVLIDENKRLSNESEQLKQKISKIESFLTKLGMDYGRFG
jgi:regulator of replication initiation timing